MKTNDAELKLVFLLLFLVSVNSQAQDKVGSDEDHKELSNGKWKHIYEMVIKLTINKIFQITLQGLSPLISVYNDEVVDKILKMLDLLISGLAAVAKMRERCDLFTCPKGNRLI